MAFFAFSRFERSKVTKQRDKGSSIAVWDRSSFAKEIEKCKKVDFTIRTS